MFASASTTLFSSLSRITGAENTEDKFVSLRPPTPDMLLCVQFMSLKEDKGLWIEAAEAYLNSTAVDLCSSGRVLLNLLSIIENLLN